MEEYLNKTLNELFEPIHKLVTDEIPGKNHRKKSTVIRAVICTRYSTYKLFMKKCLAGFPEKNLIKTLILNGFISLSITSASVLISIKNMTSLNLNAG